MYSSYDLWYLKFFSYDISAKLKLNSSYHIPKIQTLTISTRTQILPPKQLLYLMYFFELSFLQPPYFINKKIKTLQFDICDGVFVKTQTFGKDKKEFNNIIKLSNTLYEIYNMYIQLDMMISMKSFVNEDKSENILDIFIDNIRELQNGEIIVHYDSMYNRDYSDWDYLLESVKDINKSKSSDKQKGKITALTQTEFKLEEDVQVSLF